MKVVDTWHFYQLQILLLTQFIMSRKHWLPEVCVFASGIHSFFSGDLSSSCSYLVWWIHCWQIHDWQLKKTSQFSATQWFHCLPTVASSAGFPIVIHFITSSGSIANLARHVIKCSSPQRFSFFLWIMVGYNKACAFLFLHLLLLLTF